MYKKETEKPLQYSVISKRGVRLLKVHTPVAAVVILSNFNNGEFEQIQQFLRNEFSYKNDELIPLVIHSSDIRFLIIPHSVVNEVVVEPNCIVDSKVNATEIAKAIVNFLSSIYVEPTMDAGIISAGVLYSNDNGVLSKKIESCDLLIDDRPEHSYIDTLIQIFEVGERIMILFDMTYDESDEPCNDEGPEGN